MVVLKRPISSSMKICLSVRHIRLTLGHGSLKSDCMTGLEEPSFTEKAGPEGFEDNIVPFNVFAKKAFTYWILI